MQAGATFVFGQPFSLGLQMTGVTQATVSLRDAEIGSTASSGLDAGQSLLWEGIAAVTTLDETAVDYTGSALSGTDYRNSFGPNPKPATLLLVAPGLALLAPVLARRRRLEAPAASR